MRRGSSDENTRKERRVRKLDAAKLPLKRRDDLLPQGVSLRLPGAKRGEYAGLGERDVVRGGVDKKRCRILCETGALRDCGDDALRVIAKRLFVEEVERLKDEYNAVPTPDNFLKLVYSVPVGFELTARMTTNYRQLKTIYYQRRTHRLPEWREFCAWVETLPRFKELVLGGEDDEN